MKYLLLFFGIINFSLSYSQQDANWCFGDSLGIHFQNGQATLFVSAARTLETTASISDTNGNLIIYVGCISSNPVPSANDLSCFNSSNQVIQNGNSIFGLIYCFNGAILIPRPNDSNHISFFHLGFIPGSGSGLNLLYSLINNSFGTCTIVAKNSLLNDSLFTERILAVKHANGRDWWIIGRIWWTDNFATYLLEPNGLSGPFYQSIGSPNTFYYDGGQMVANKSGEKVVMADNNGTLELFDFDRCTGQFSNYIPLYIATTQLQKWRMFYGCSFSPGSRYLYVSTYDSLLQFDLHASNILSSQLKIFDINDSTRMIGQHAPAPDGKIYISSTNFITNLVDSQNTHLSVITDPDQPDTLCNFQPFSFSLGGRRSFLGLPNLPNFNLGLVSGSVCDSLSPTGLHEINKEAWSMDVFPLPADNRITLEFNQALNDQINLRLVNGVGKEVYRVTITCESTNYPLDVSNLPTGFYLLEAITVKGEKIYRKIVVTR